MNCEKEKQVLSVILGYCLKCFTCTGNIDVKPLSRSEGHSVSSKDQGSLKSKTHFIFYEKEFSETKTSWSVALCIL